MRTMALRRITLAALVTGGLLTGLQGPAHAASEFYVVSSATVVQEFGYAWYRDLPAKIHQEGLTYFMNWTNVAMCTADWDRGNLYRLQTFAPHTEGQGDYTDTDAIVDCRYFLQ